MKRLIGLVMLICTLNTYAFNVEKATDYLSTHYLSKSHCCCVWFVMRALQTGGLKIGIAPPWAYKYILPSYGFKQVPQKNYTPKKGDVAIISNSKQHFWGHICMYNGKCWISDFKQKHMNPYGRSYPYVVFRYGLNGDRSKGSMGPGPIEPIPKGDGSVGHLTF